MAKVDTSTYQTFDDVTGRLDEIVESVRDKQTSLERSLDLFDEAIALGSRAVDLVDKVDFTPEELERLSGKAGATVLADGEGADVSSNGEAQTETLAPSSGR